MSPEEIINRAIDRYESPLIAYARAITGELESARDAVQETFLRLSKQDVVKLEPRLAAWLFFVCRNCALDHCRKIARFSDSPPAEEPRDPSPTPSESAGASEDFARLRGLLGRLPEQQRTLIHLKFDTGLSYREMSEATRMSVTNVGFQLHTALQTLRRLWNQQNPEVIP